jgi:hypothetical protein
MTSHQLECILNGLRKTRKFIILKLKLLCFNLKNQIQNKPYEEYYLRNVLAIV